jgi:hypothetical protein
MFIAQLSWTFLSDLHDLAKPLPSLRITNHFARAIFRAGREREDRKRSEDTPTIHFQVLQNCENAPRREAITLGAFPGPCGAYRP